MAKSKTPVVKKKRHITVVTQGGNNVIKSSKVKYASIYDEKGKFEISINTLKNNGSLRKNALIRIEFPDGNSWSGTIKDIKPAKF
jgi:hypothetical protein